MKYRSLLGHLALTMILSQAVAQDELSDMDLTEPEDLQQLVEESAPATSNETTTEAVTSETVAEPAAAQEAPVESTEAPLELSEAPSEAAAVSTETPPTIEPLEETPAPLTRREERTTGLAGDDLDDIKADLRDTELSDTATQQLNEEFKPAVIYQQERDEAAASARPTEQDARITNDPLNTKTPLAFDVGKEEKELLSLASSVQGQVSNNEWNELATAAKVSSYTVVKDDWLFKISKRLFGTGFYYPKIWSLNPYITNPHLIEPGMILSFSTGSLDRAPEVKVGEFSDSERNSEAGSNQASYSAEDFSIWGEDAKPDWLAEKQSLIDQGIYVQYSTGETMEDLDDVSKISLIKEYENYEPPRSELDSLVPASQYDETGLDKNSRIVYSFKEGFYLNTFVSNNIVQDFGKLDAGPDQNMFFVTHDHAYIQFDESLNVLPGDMFSIYSAQGKVKHTNSDREGYKYTITGHIKAIAKVEDKWEVQVTHATGLVQRGDRVTVYTPKIERITQTFSNRIIEAAIIASHSPSQIALSYGDVIYLDRGRADGVEMGNVFEVYGFKDRATGKNITDQPTYKNGELTVITLTDNFSTVLVSQSMRDFFVGDIAITKTKEAALRASKAAKLRMHGDTESLAGKGLEELDVELNLEDLNDSLLDKADKIQLTEDELAELERQEREKSIIKESEKDLKSLERLEREIENAEKLLNEAKLDEDKLLEDDNLNDLEKKRAIQQQESLDEIEENLGKRYIDEDLNSKDNPYGLTEFDIEEIDELLNVQKEEKK